MFGRKKTDVPTPEDALPGRSEPMDVPERHFVNGNPLMGPWPDDLATAVFGMGCFWGAERLFWQADGVYSTAVGYAGGSTPNPTYRETCTGRTGHTEAVLVVYDPSKIGFEELTRIFWEGHDPTQGMRQGNDVGSQYRSALFTTSDAQLEIAKTTRDRYQEELNRAGYGPITTEIGPLDTFYYAEDYHQQYLAKNPDGYCGIGGTGVSCPTGLAT